MNGKKLLIVLFIVFLAVIIFITVDMANRTVKPWGKNNNVLKKYDPGRK